MFPAKTPLKIRNPNIEIRNKQEPEIRNSKIAPFFVIRICFGFRISCFEILRRLREIIFSRFHLN